jgi:hypothetical protein
MNDMSGMPGHGAGGRIELALDVKTWGLPLTEAERRADVARITVLAPTGFTTVIVLLEGNDGIVISMGSAMHASQAQLFNADKAADIARRRALERLSVVRDVTRERRELRSRSMGSPCNPSRHGVRHGDR